jgi:ParB family chromosome partitioning protein
MNIVTLDLDKIDDSDRLRPVDEAWAKVIAASIEEQGQLSPIEVEEPDENGIHKLIIGAHRTWAMRHIGRRTIQAIVSPYTGAEARLREIDENLARADLNDLDRAIFLGERKRAYEELHPSTKHKKGKGKQQVANLATILRFTLETARLTKESERTIQRLVRRYENIDPAVRERLRGTWLAQIGTELDALSRLSAPEQTRVVEMLLREEEPQPNVATALRMVRGITVRPEDATDKQLAALMTAWNKAGKPARQQFRDFLAKPASRRGTHGGD